MEKDPIRDGRRSYDRQYVVVSLAINYLILESVSNLLVHSM